MIPNLYSMCLFSNWGKNKKPQTVVVPDPPKVEEPPKPTTRRIITSMTVRNNAHPDYFFNYYNREGNPFGLSWSTNNKDTDLILIQKKDPTGDHYEAICRLRGHSITSIEWDTITIEPDEPKHL